MAIVVWGVGISSKVLLLQLIAAHSYVAILIRGVFPQNSSHCSPILTSFYPLWTKYPPHSYIILPPIDKLPPPPLSTKWEDFREDIWDAIVFDPSALILCFKSPSPFFFWLTRVEFLSKKSVRNPVNSVEKIFFTTKRPHHFAMNAVKALTFCRISYF